MRPHARSSVPALALITALSAHAGSESQHVPPAPPARPMPDMPYHDMVEMMQMDDTARAGMVQLDRFEWRSANAGAWDAHAWYGDDYNKLWFKTEGERARGRTEGARAELYWDRIVARWWSLQVGARQDFGSGPSRTWAAIGTRGLAPQWFDIEATLYLSDGGRTAARFQAQYELLLTQRLIIQPQLEMNLYGKSDPPRGLGSGLSDLEVGLRLRYEFRREFAPYVGLTWSGTFGETADFKRANAEEPRETRVVAGVRVWF